MAAVPLKEARLYGGCFALKLPVGFVDVSDFRDLPDTQECWAHAETDQSFIVEILAHEDKVDGETSAVFYFNDIASCNDSLEHSVRVGPTDSSELMRKLLASEPAAPVDVDVGSPSCWVLQGR